MLKTTKLRVVGQSDLKHCIIGCKKVVEPIDKRIVMTKTILFFVLKWIFGVAEWFLFLISVAMLSKVGAT
ncbi:hypothetical protein [Desulfosporosinus shakirovi]|uniref:hypothetical protein n=1 Tax=Desulfosporosinus shakirovi TaxID=2885154 RepID=UPI001E3A96C5|nr:hypothetical protein [Desulfosporosinus sp. SRJS8]MCB8814478.1 hypothetical protein [Desulfosporosinus sp. SRJS8]